MLCEGCGAELLIDRCETRVEGDDSPTAQTRVFTLPVLYCRNPGCSRFGKEFYGEAILTYPKG